jgi:hypothetical protein
MTILEKTTHQNQNPSKIFLFKEGIFYKAYNEGAFLLKDKNYKVAVKKIKRIEKEVLSIGFPESVFDKLKIEFVVEDFEGYSCCNNKVVFDQTEYQNWHSEKLHNQPDNSNSTNHHQIIDAIKNYPLANKTPIEVFEWVVNLQIKIKKNIVNFVPLW